MITGFVYIDLTGHPISENGEFTFKDDKIKEQLLTGKPAIITEKRATSKVGTKIFYSLNTYFASMSGGYHGTDSSLSSDLKAYSINNGDLIISVNPVTGEVDMIVSNINL